MFHFVYITGSTAGMLNEALSKDLSASDTFRDEFKRSLGDYFVGGTQYYTHVNVLLLYWEEDDLGCQKELKKLTGVLEEHFHYQFTSSLFPLGDLLEWSPLLQREISEFVLKHSLESTLTVIYYAGHGDPDDETVERQRKLILAAKEQGGPILRWSDVQPALNAADGDMLLLLDCCHASLAARSLRSPEIEILAACAMNLTTAGVGRRSFTSAIISQLKEVSRASCSISVLALHSWLSSDLAGLSESPFHFGSAKSHGGSIVLKPLPQPPMPQSILIHPRESVASITLRVQFLEDPEVKELASWVKTSAPSSVAAIDIERALFHRQKLQQFLTQKEIIGLTENSLLDSADKDDKAALLKTLSAVEQVKPLEEGTLNRQLADPGLAIDTYERLKRSNKSLFRLIRELIFSSSSSQTAEGLDILEGNKLARSTGLSNSASVMMILANDGCAGARQVELESLNIQETKHSLICGTIGGQEVLIEYKEASQDSYGCVPKETTERVPLAPGIDRPALGQRFKLTHKIAQAVYCFHSHGWVHKNLRSENIIFLQEKDYDEPWLFGPEYCRLESDFSSRRNDWNIERNIYRHPERWGRPGVPAKKVHDIYGVIPLEIRLWQRAITLSLDTTNGFRHCKRGEAVQSQFREQTQARLGYTMGEKYQRIVSMCLDGHETAFDVEAENKNDSKFLRTFREQVLDVLESSERARRVPKRLHCAAEVNNLSAAKFLAGKGLNTRARTRSGATPLHIAVQKNGALEMIKALIDWGGNVDDIENEIQLTVLGACLETPTTDASIIDYLVEQSNSMVVSKNNRTILHLAAVQVSMVNGRFLLGVLLKHKKVRECINTVDSDGWTALHIAVLRVDVYSTLTLMNAGADVTIRTSGSRLSAWDIVNLAMTEPSQSDNEE
ncbi:hypothetical protein BDZ45DRAFT_750839 [Acephala macrosclerotiorum]|nr:hypothetical protein BDZ45DRAFT_750839 [Acephala macrosclerotiorum]